jgi:hypothetical protein
MLLNCKKGTARLILDQDPITPSEPLFKQLGWITIEQRIKYHKYLLFSKCLRMKHQDLNISYFFKEDRFLMIF